MKKYIFLFLKNRLRIIFLTGTLLFLLFFFVLLLNSNTAYTPVFALWAFAPALAWYGIDLLLTIHFRRLIRYQEKLLNVVFHDANAVPLFPGSMTYLSDDWLIFSGTAAFHRQYIKSITIRTFHTNRGNDCKIKVQTRTGRTYMRAIASYTDGRKIKQWLDLFKAEQPFIM